MISVNTSITLRHRENPKKNHTTMFRRCATNVVATRALVQTRSVRTLNAYSVFMKQVYKTNKFPQLKTKLASLKSSKKAFATRATLMSKAYKTLGKPEVAALKAAGKKIKQKAPITRKMKYLKNMQKSPKVKGLKGDAKLKTLTKMWAKRQGLKSV